MQLRLVGLTLLLGLFAAAAAQQLPPPAAAYDPEVAAQEVRDFYSSYGKAWDDRNAEAVSDHLAADFTGYFYAEPHGIVQTNKKAAVAGVRSFFEALSRREALWRRSILSIEPRSDTEAIAAVRNDFSLEGAGGETELALEVLRKEPDGHWRLVRRWSEKHSF